MNSITVEASCPRCGETQILPALSAPAAIVCPACQHQFPPGSATDNRLDQARAAQRGGKACLRTGVAFLGGFLVIVWWQPVIGLMLAAIGVFLLLAWAFISTR